jgi:penicillin amidase
VKWVLARFVWVVVLLCSGVLASVGISTWSVVHTEGPPASGKLSLTGLGGPVTISRDAFGVPHIRAQRAADGMFGLGFVHAQDRLWQMEVLRRAAAGTLSELFGRETLDQDRLARTLELRRAAEDEVARLPPEHAALLDAYASGVNAWLRVLPDSPASRPAELRWLDHQPRSWTIADTLSVVRLRAFMLSRSMGASLLLERLNRDLGGAQAQDFFPRQPPPPRVVGAMHRLGRIADRFASVAGLHGNVGSLGFLVGGARSESGLPMLANDPHVMLQVPAVFYLAHLETGQQTLAGGTWPGVPVFWFGHNRRIAWGQVALHAVVSDLFDEALRPDRPGEYWERGRWVAAERRMETIRVRYAPSQELHVVTTHNGPLLGALLPDLPAAASYSLRWTGRHPRSGINALLRLQQAPTWTVFRSALRTLPGPPATFLYADVEGRAGTQVAGLFPLRAVASGLLSVPSEYAWRGYVPFEELPSDVSRTLGWRVVSTRGDGSPFPAATEWLWEDGGASARLDARLRASPRMSIDDVLAIQRECFSEPAVAAVAEWLDGLTPTSEASRRAAEILRAWDGRTTTDDIGAAVYHVFRQRLTARLLELRFGYAEEFVALTRDAEPLPGVLISRFLERTDPALARSLREQALADTWALLTIEVSGNPRRWTWGRVHQLELLHSFRSLAEGRLGWIGGMLGRGPYPAPGDPDSVWTMHHGGALPESRAVVGPGARYAVDLADLTRARVGLAGGQSGHPGSRFYDDGLAAWLAGEPRPLWIHPVDVAYHEAGRWELVPAAKPVAPEGSAGAVEGGAAEVRAAVDADADVEANVNPVPAAERE